MKIKIHLCYAFFTLAMVSFISSCLFFLLVASESTKIQKNLDEHQNAHTTNINNNNNNFDRIEEIKRHEHENVRNEHDFYTTENANAVHFRHEINAFLQEQEQEHQKQQHQHEKRKDDEGGGADKTVNSGGGGGSSGAIPINPNDFHFLETISKNSGVTENDLTDVQTPPIVTLIEPGSKELLETAIEDKLENVIKLQKSNMSLKEVTKISSENNHDTNEYIVIAEPKTGEQTQGGDKGLANDSNINQNDINLNGSDLNLVQASENASVDVNMTEEHPIPVFSEWAQKHIEESEKLEQESVSNLSTTKKNSTVKLPNVKLRAKNYASPDCGAKIIASNAEAQSTSSVLSTSKDEYMLNPCQSKIWFVVELCEPIRAEKIDLANFELFSSSPKEFSVAVSNRYPTRDWTIVGQFTARDERNIQKFKLHPHLFGKFVKVEVHSHYNSEHFCPISLFSVYGTSEFEAFATENEQPTSAEFFNEDDDDEVLDDGVKTSGHNHRENPNLLKSAGEAVMSIVKKAAEVLTKSNDRNDKNVVSNQTVIVDTSSRLGYTANYQIQCRNCSKFLLVQLQKTLEHNYQDLMKLLGRDEILKPLVKSDICAPFFDYKVSRTSNPQGCGRLHLFPADFVPALCNILFNRKSFRFSWMTAERLTKKDEDRSDVGNVEDLTFTNLTIDDKVFSGENVPSKTRDRLNSDRSNLVPSTDGDCNTNSGSKLSSEPGSQSDIVDTGGKILENDSKIEPSTTDQHKPETSTVVENKNTLQDAAVDVPALIEDVKNNSNSEEKKSEVVEKGVQDVAAADSSVKELEPSEAGVNEIPAPIEPVISGGEQSGETKNQNGNGNQALPMGTPKGQQSDSVFLRLSSRIKSLERNLSLSEQYLEELSRRYKKQVEELQQSFAKLLNTVEEQNRRNSDREQLLSEQNQKLRLDLDDLSERVGLWYNLYFFIFILAEVIILWAFIRGCRRNPQPPTTTELDPEELKEIEKLINSKQFLKMFKKRRKSLEYLKSGDKNEIKPRRLSEEALQTYGTYDNLLICNGNEIGNGDYENDIEIVDQKKKGKQRQRKISIPLHKRAVSMEPTSVNGKNGNVKLKSNLCRHESAPGEFLDKSGEGVSSVYLNGFDVDGSPLMDENDEFYMPNNDLALNEFMPDGPSYHPNSSGQQPSVKSKDKESKARRLSSPAFLKSALSRGNITSKKSPNHETTTGWEWYKLKKNSSTNSSQQTTANDSRREKTPPITVIGNTNLLNPSIQRSTNGKTSSAYVADDQSSISSGSKKSSSGNSFRKLFKKVF